MTEDEAKTKWCPFVRGVIEKMKNERGEILNAFVGNRYSDNEWPFGSVCIGSACMAWRLDMTGWVLRHDEKGMLMRPGKEGPQGYCGLAGKP